jgi:replicative DNA helicase
MQGAYKMANHMPHDAGAELAVISSMIFDAPALDYAVDALTDKDFYRPDYALCFATLVDMHTKKQSVDLVTLKAALDTSGHFDKIGGMQALTAIASAVSTSVNIAQYAAIVANKAVRRRIIAAAHNIGQDARDEGQSLDDLRCAAEAIKAIAETTQDAGVHVNRAKSALSLYVADIGKPHERILTGFAKLDKYIGGIRSKSLVTIGAYPSVGKTAFALNIAMAQTAPVVIFSLEMSAEMIFERLVSMTRKIDYGIFDRPTLTEYEQTEVKTACDELAKRELYVFDDIYDAETHGAIIANIKPKLVIVDFLQIATTQRKFDAERLRVDYMTGIYKAAAKAHNCVVLLLSQISRAGRNEPTMASLKESGGTEANSDYVGLLHRPYVLDKKGEAAPEEAYLLLDKNKFGRTGKRDFIFRGEYQAFYETTSVDKYFKPMASNIPTPFD